MTDPITAALAALNEAVGLPTNTEWLNVSAEEGAALRAGSKLLLTPTATNPAGEDGLNPLTSYDVEVVPAS